MLGNLFYNLFGDMQTFIRQALYSLPAILIALSFHEWAHAYAAFRMGDPTARNLGRMTINPLHHIDPLGFIMLLVVHFGWAKPVPINPRNFKNPRRDDTIVSLAGVCVNFLLALASMLVIYIYLIAGGSNGVLAYMLYYFCIINLSLMVFNLIPIPPLDGSHVLENLLIRRVGPKPFYFLSRYGNYILLILLISGSLTGILGTVVNAILHGMSYMFRAIFGFDGLQLLYFFLG